MGDYDGPIVIPIQFANAGCLHNSCCLNRNVFSIGLDFDSGRAWHPVRPLRVCRGHLAVATAMTLLLAR